MAEIALRNIGRRAKHKVTRPEIKVGDMVRIKVKPIESRGLLQGQRERKGIQGSLRRERGDGEGWPEKVAHRDLRKVPENSAPEPRGLEVQSRQRRLPGSRLLLTLSALLRLYNVSDSSACHSLTSFFTSGRAGGSGGPP